MFFFNDYLDTTELKTLLHHNYFYLLQEKKCLNKEHKYRQSNIAFHANTLKETNYHKETIMQHYILRIMHKLANEKSQYLFK